MSEAMRSRITYANVTATLALFLALGGGAWALSKNSVGHRALKAGSVRASEIAKGAVRSHEVKNETLTGFDIAANTVGGGDVNESTLFNDNSLTGTDVNESTLFNDNSIDAADIDESSLAGLAGIPAVHGGQDVASGFTDTIQLAEGSFTWACGNPMEYQNDSGATANLFSYTGVHNDVAGGSETVFASNSPVADGATANPFVQTPGLMLGAIVTDDHLATFELWHDFNAGTCDYLFRVTEVPRD